MDERKSRKRKNKTALCFWEQEDYDEVQENYDNSNVVSSPSQQRLPDSTSVRLNRHNDKRKSSKKRMKSPNRCPSSPESDNFAKPIFEKSGNDRKKRKSVSKQKINETVSICPLEISFDQNTPSRSYELTLSPKSPLETEFSDEGEESVLNKVINRDSVETSLLTLPLVSKNISSLIEALSGLKKCNRKRKQESKVYASKQKIPFKNSDKKSLCDYALDGETKKNLISACEAYVSNKTCHQASLKEDCVNSKPSSTGTKTIVRKSVKKKVEPQKKNVSFCENIEVNYVNVKQSPSNGRLSVEKSLLALPQTSENIFNPFNRVHSGLENNNKKEKIKVQTSRAFKNQLENSGENNSLHDDEFDAETDGSRISSSETYIACKICNQTDMKKGSGNSDTHIGTNNRKSGRRRKKRISICRSIEEDDFSDYDNLRRSTRTRRSPLRSWCNERARYRILENGDIAFVDITDK